MQQTFTIKNPTGIHARPAGNVVKAASAFSSKIELENEKGTRVNAKGMVGILKLGLKQGEQVIVFAEGDDDVEALNAVGALLETEFE